MSGQHLDELRAEPGQFFRWRFLTRSTWRAAHPFSLVRAADQPPAADHRQGPGRRDAVAERDLRPGTMVLAEGPYGAITGRRRRRPRVLLIAGGVGITPMRALFETLDLPGSDLTLIYRAAERGASGAARGAGRDRRHAGAPG